MDALILFERWIYPLWNRKIVNEHFSSRYTSRVESSLEVPGQVTEAEDPRTVSNACEVLGFDSLITIVGVVWLSELIYAILVLCKNLRVSFFVAFCLSLAAANDKL